MEETKVTYDTAILAKEKGFNEPCIFWNDGGTTQFAGHRMDSTIKNKEIEEQHFYKRIPFSCAIPTQSLLQKWLREKHKIFVVIIPIIEKNVFISTIEIKNKRFHLEKQFKSYESALEQGLFEALKKIKK